MKFLFFCFEKAKMRYILNNSRR